MPELKGIPVVPEVSHPRSGEKYVTPQGFTAIRDGIKARDDNAAAGLTRKPPWLRARAPGGEGFTAVRNVVREHRLATVCEEAKCPNIGMLERRHRHHHAHGRRLYARLPLLLGRHR